MPLAQDDPSPPSDADDDQRGPQPMLPRWRRPSPLWIFPLGVLITLSLTLPISAQPEILINLVCTASPPIEVGGVNSPVESIASPMFPGIDPKQCRHDVAVQKRTAQLQMCMNLVAGLLGVLTTGFWTGLSDRIGRTKIIAACILGLALTQVTYLLISSSPSVVTYVSIYILIIGPALDGIFGGLPTFSAIMGATIADTSPKASASMYLTAANGCFCGGVLVGPALGTFLIKQTGDLLFPNKLSVVILIIAMILSLAILPESLSKEMRDQAIKKAAAEREEAAAREAAERAWEEGEGGHNGPLRAARRVMRTWTRRAFTPFEPLRILAPQARDDDEPRRGRDWNLFILAGASFAVTLTHGNGGPGMQYIQYTFGWDQTELGPLLSFLTACRFVTLMVIFPLLTRYVKPRFTGAGVTTSTATEAAESICEALGEETPLILNGHNAVGTGTYSGPAAEVADPPNGGQLGASETAAKGIRFDYSLLCICISVYVCCCTVLGTNVKASATLFVFTMAVASLGSPVNPYSNSLALELKPHDIPAGRLFGAFGIVEASTTFIGAPLFTTVFSSTIATYPPAVFLVSAFIFLSALIGIQFIRLPRVKTTGAPTD